MARLGSPLSLPDGFGQDPNVARQFYYQLAGNHLTMDATHELKKLLYDRNLERQKAKYDRELTTSRGSYVKHAVKQRVTLELQNPDQAILRALTEGLLGGQITQTVPYPPIPHPADDHLRHLNDPAKAQIACPGYVFRPTDRWWDPKDPARYIFHPPAQQSSTPTGHTVLRAISDTVSAPSPIPADPHAPTRPSDALDRRSLTIEEVLGYPSTSQQLPQLDTADGSSQTGPPEGTMTTTPPPAAEPEQSLPVSPPEQPSPVDMEDKKGAESPEQSDDEATRAIEVTHDTASAAEDTGEPLHMETGTSCEDLPADRPQLETPLEVARANTLSTGTQDQSGEHPDPPSSTPYPVTPTPQPTHGRRDPESPTNVPSEQFPPPAEQGTATAQPLHEPAPPVDRQYSKGPMHGQAPRHGHPAKDRSRKRHREQAMGHEKKKARREREGSKKTRPTSPIKRHLKHSTSKGQQSHTLTSQPSTSAPTNVASKRTGDAAATSKQPKTTEPRSRSEKRSTKKKRKRSPASLPRLQEPKFTRGKDVRARAKPQITAHATRLLSDFQSQIDQQKSLTKSVTIPKRKPTAGGTNQPPTRDLPPDNERPQKSIVQPPRTTDPAAKRPKFNQPPAGRTQLPDLTKEVEAGRRRRKPADTSRETPAPSTHDTNGSRQPTNPRPQTTPPPRTNSPLPANPIALSIEESIQAFRDLGEIQIWIQNSIQRQATIEATVAAISMPPTEQNRIWQPEGIHYPHERPSHAMVPFALTLEPRESYVSMAEQRDPTKSKYVRINHLALYAYNRTRRLHHSDPDYLQMATTLGDPFELKGKPRTIQPTKNVCASFRAHDLPDLHKDGKIEALERAKKRDPNTEWTELTFPRLIDLHLEWAVKTSSAHDATIQPVKFAIERFNLLAGGMDDDFRKQKASPTVLKAMVKDWSDLFVKKVPETTPDNKPAHKITRQYIKALLRRKVITTQDVDSLMAIDDGAIYRVTNNISEMELYRPGAAFFAAEPRGLLASSYQYVEDTSARTLTDGGNEEPTVTAARYMTHRFMEILDAADVRQGNLAVLDQTQPERRLRHVTNTESQHEVKPCHDTTRMEPIQARTPLDPLAEIPYMAGPFLMTCPLQGVIRDLLTLAVEIGFDANERDMKATALRLHAALSTGEAMNAYEVLFMWTQVKALLNAAVRDPQNDSRTSHLCHALFNIFDGVASKAPDCCLITRIWHRQLINMIMSNPQVFAWFMALPTDRQYQLNDPEDKDMYGIPKDTATEPEMQVYSNDIVNATVALVKRSLEDLVLPGKLPPWVTGLQVLLTRALDDDWDEQVDLRKVKYEAILHTFALMASNSYRRSVSGRLPLAAAREQEVLARNCCEEFYDDTLRTAAQIIRAQRYFPVARTRIDPVENRPLDPWGINDQPGAIPASPEEDNAESPNPATASSTPTQDEVGTPATSPRVPKTARLPPTSPTRLANKTDAKRDSNATQPRLPTSARRTRRPRGVSEQAMKDRCRNNSLRPLVKRCDHELPTPPAAQPITRAKEPKRKTQVLRSPSPPRPPRQKDPRRRQDHARADLGRVTDHTATTSRSKSTGGSPRRKDLPRTQGHMRTDPGTATDHAGVTSRLMRLATDQAQPQLRAPTTNPADRTPFSAEELHSMLRHLMSNMPPDNFARIASAQNSYQRHQNAGTPFPVNFGNLPQLVHGQGTQSHAFHQYAPTQAPQGTPTPSFMAMVGQSVWPYGGQQPTFVPQYQWTPPSNMPSTSTGLTPFATQPLPYGQGFPTNTWGGVPPNQPGGTCWPAAQAGPWTPWATTQTDPRTQAGAPGPPGHDTAPWRRSEERRTQRQYYDQPGGRYYEGPGSQPVRVHRPRGSVRRSTSPPTDGEYESDREATRSNRRSGRR